METEPRQVLYRTIGSRGRSGDGMAAVLAMG